MILYFSSATNQDTFNELFKKGLISGACPAQNFNYNIIEGLSRFEKVFSISAVPYNDVDVDSFCLEKGNVQYYTIANKKGKLRKISNIIQLTNESKSIIKKNDVKYIICDAISTSANIVAHKISKEYNIPCIAIITDIPSIMNHGNTGRLDKMLENIMTKYDGYVFLTEAMSEYINKNNKPYIIIEGLFNFNDKDINVDKKEHICMYSGAIWKNSGFEEMINGFEMANKSDMQLHIYGDGDGKDGVVKLCDKYENVKYMGCVSLDEIRKKQRQAYLLVNPRKSVNEYTKYSFPSKTMEYMSSGTPSLMTKLPGIPEEYYKYVYTVENESAEGFCDAFKKIFEQTEENLEKKGKDAQNFIFENKNSLVQTQRLYDFIQGI